MLFHQPVRYNNQALLIMCIVFEVYNLRESSNFGFMQLSLSFAKEENSFVSVLPVVVVIGCYALYRLLFCVTVKILSIIIYQLTFG